MCTWSAAPSGTTGGGEAAAGIGWDRSYVSGWDAGSQEKQQDQPEGPGGVGVHRAPGGGTEEAVAIWADTRRAVTAARERRLREAGLVEVWSGFGASGRIVVCTRGGLKAVCRQELSTPRPSPTSLPHACTTATVAACLERQGHRVLTEREIMVHERNEGQRIYSAGVDNGRFHRPDLIVLGDLPEAIEVELSDKSNRRLDEILKGWRWAILEKKVSRVRYLCSPRAMSYVTRAVERMPVSGWIEVERLKERDGQWVHAGPRLPLVVA